MQDVILQWRDKTTAPNIITQQTVPWLLCKSVEWNIQTVTERGKNRSESRNVDLCALKCVLYLSAWHTDKPEVDPLSSEVLFLSAGDPLHLSCWAKGNPTPTYHWKHPSHVPPHRHSGDFIINSTTSSDGGQYTCFVSNSVGNVTITFQVQVKGEFEIFGLFSLRTSFDNENDVKVYSWWWLLA